MLFGKGGVVFIACDTFLVLFYGLRKIFQYPILKVVMLGQIALLQYLQFRHLHIQIHFFLETLVPRGKHLDLRKGKSYLVHILGGTHGAFTRHYLADKFLLALHQLIEVGIKCLLGYIAVNLYFWEQIALPFNTPLTLFKVRGSPRTIEVMDSDKPVLHIRACTHFLCRA